MGRLWKSVLFIIIGMIGLLIVGLIVLTVYHHNQLAKEEELFKHTGKLVEVNGNQMHIHNEEIRKFIDDL